MNLKGRVFFLFSLLVMGVVLACSPAYGATPPSDLDGDGKSDIWWYNASTGETSVWLMNGTAMTGFVYMLNDPNWKIINSPDLNGDVSVRLKPC